LTIDEVNGLLCKPWLNVPQAGAIFGLNRSTENVEMIRKLQEVYTRHLIPVTDVIHGKSRSAASVAGAFRLPKD